MKTCVVSRKSVMLLHVGGRLVVHNKLHQCGLKLRKKHSTTLFIPEVTSPRYSRSEDTNETCRHQFRFFLHLVDKISAPELESQV